MAKDTSNLPGNTGATPNPQTPQPVAGGTAQPAAPAAAAGGSPALFGGHRGGGKRRADGLPAGSEAAREADRRKNRERMQAKRAAALPSPLPAASVVASPAAAPDTGLAMVGDSVPVPFVAAGIAGAVVVPWSIHLLEKPAKLLTRILDRIRTGQIFKKLDKTNLPVEIKAEIKRDAAWKDAARDDFAICLADCATKELNKRRVPGSENAHWINLGLAGGELALAHVDLCARIDKLVESEQQKSEPQKAAEGAKASA